MVKIKRQYNIGQHRVSQKNVHFSVYHIDADDATTFHHFRKTFRDFNRIKI